MEDGDLLLHTIGDASAQGICGSGLIDAIAALLDAGVIDWTGLIDLDHLDQVPPPLRARVVKPAVDPTKAYKLQFVNKKVGIELRPKN